ncbi:MAG TPA: Ig-like domain-containing protein [Thermoanaerobaculia bacterium]|nr:Ig-like domain-containing protein [Thermoanaerobaculia bacterium]
MWRRVTRGLVLSSLFTLLLPALHAQGFIGSIDSPVDGERLSGVVLVRGWALDEQPISRVDLYIDDQFQFPANLNLPRIDVVAAYPNWPGIQTRQPGFIIGFSTNRFPDGPHTIHFRVTTLDNRTSELGRRTVVIDNSINQSPIGWIDIPDTSSVFDANGSFPVVGWAVDTDGVARIDVLVDGLNMQSAIYGDPRPDVGNTFPDLPAAAFSGFVANVDTTRLLDGVHTLTVRATDRLGFTRNMGSRTVQVFNNTNNLRPFGFLDEPLRDAELFGTCEGLEQPVCQISPCTPFDIDNHLTPVRGWALDLGTRSDTGRVAYIELLIDGVRYYSTDDCSFNSDLGAYVNCYGLTRFDVARYYPNYPDAPRSGFLFTLDVGVLMASGVRPGLHVMKLRVGDQEQTFSEIPGTAGIPVFFRCAEDRNDFPSFGYIDFPTSMDFVGGTVTFFGWALDQSFGGVRNVEIFVDGNLMGMAAYGSVRADVREAYPIISNSLHSGWTFTLDTRQLSDAQHRLTVQVVDNAGNRTIIGSRDFVVDNLP